MVHVLPPPIFFTDQCVFYHDYTILLQHNDFNQKNKVRFKDIRRFSAANEISSGDVFSIGMNVRTGQDYLMLPCFLHANVTFPSSFFLSYMLIWTDVYKSFKSFPSWLYIAFLTCTRIHGLFTLVYRNGNFIKIVIHRIMIYDKAYPQFDMRF